MVNEFAERRAGAGQVPLPDHLIQAARPHPHGERRGGVLRFPRRRVKQALGLPVTPGHAPSVSLGRDRRFCPCCLGQAGCPGGCGTASIPASFRWAAVIGVGAPVSGSSPDAAFGNAITSRIVSRPASSISVLSQPNAIPPCGGAP